MPLAYYRLSPAMFVRLIITVGTAFVIAFVPNYQKNAYKSTPARDYEKLEDNTGYPAGEGYVANNSTCNILKCNAENSASERYKIILSRNKKYK